MTVRDDMTNGFKIAHGGVAYSLADSALAFAANSHGTKSLSIETSISYTKKVETSDTLTAIAKEIKNEFGESLMSDQNPNYFRVTWVSNSCYLFN